MFSMKVSKLKHMKICFKKREKNEYVQLQLFLYQGIH